MLVALADDHAFVRDCLRTLLVQADEGIEVIEAESYADLIATLRADGPVDLCVLDLKMPDQEPMAGLDLVMSAFPGLPVVVMSSIMEPATIEKVLARGVRGYIPKKLSAAATIEAIRLIMKGEMFVPSQLFQPRAEAKKAKILTDREEDIMGLLRSGMPNKAIARKLNISVVTVKAHLSHIFQKLEVQNRVQAAQQWRGGD